MQFIDQILQNRANPDKIKYDFPALKSILGSTFGVLCYQEQCMKAVVELAGYEKSDSDGFRKVVAKKIQSLLPLHKQWFITGRKKEDIDEANRIVEYPHAIPGGIAMGHKKEDLEKFFHQMEEFAKYSFNKSHGASYAVLAYVTAWLSCYYPAEYFSAVLDYANGRTDEITKKKTSKDAAKMVKYVTALRERGISVTDISINNSGKNFIPLSDKKIGYPLTTKGVKDIAANLIIEERNRNGEYTDFISFLTRNAINLDKGSFNSWSNCGAFKDFGYTKSTLVAAQDDIFKRIFSTPFKNKIKNGDMTFKEAKGLIEDKLFNGMHSKAYDVDTMLPPLKEFSRETELRLEKEYLGHYLSGNPLEPYKMIIEDCRNEIRTVHRFIDLSDLDYEIDEDTGEVITNGTLSNEKLVKTIACIDSVRVFSTRNDDLMAVLHIIDLNGECEVLLWPNVYEKFAKIIKEDDVYEIKGELSISDDKPPQIILEDIKPISRASSRMRTCTFFIKDKFEASNVCKVLLNASKINGTIIPTYLKAGGISILIPKEYSMKEELINRIDTDMFKMSIE